MTIDWSKPIEAYHEDGRVASHAAVLKMLEGGVMVWVESAGFRLLSANREGTIPGVPMTIRNVPDNRTIINEAYGVTDSEEEPPFAHCEKTVADVVEFLRSIYMDGAADRVSRHFLPPKDPAQALVDAYREDIGRGAWKDVKDDEVDSVIRWLHQSGKLKEEG